jgi:uracil-DNA glycosylase
MEDSGAPCCQESALFGEMRACRRCLAAGYAVHPGAVFSGSITAWVMVVGQAPGAAEVEVARPFHGAAGRRLFRWLEGAGWTEAEFRATQYITAVTKCYPGKSPGGKGDRVPTRTEQKLCAPFLERELALVQPKVVIPVGGVAVRRFLGPARLAEVVGRAVTDDEDRLIVALPHPSGASLWLNRPENQERVARALTCIRRLRQQPER